VEQIEQALPRFLHAFGLPENVALPQANSNPDRDRAGYLPSPDERQLIRQMNQADLRLYERLLGLPPG